ncbi:hypothetical protein BJY04DRAFT_176730 [Aspergillus karnatakaensis]|uniref:uncharacterized protein n=1 Tax=Aspergillus karnatakaensis TaxID=1810916 RepID=UPI003CCE32CC
MTTKTKAKARPKHPPGPPVLSWRVGAAPSKQSKTPRKDELTGSSLRQPHHPPESQAHPAICEIGASLDPFCQLPCTLSPTDRSLLHSYLLQVPARVYGTHPIPIFSSVRDVSFPISLGSALTMHWMLIAANGLFTNSGQRDKLLLAQRKQQAYELLNDTLARSGGSITDEVFGGIVMAAITEARLSDLTACSAHLQGFEAAISIRGGLRASLLACASPALRLAHLMPYLVSEPLPDTGHDGSQQLQLFVEFLAVKMHHPRFSPVLDNESTELLPAQTKDMAIRPLILPSSLAFYLRHDARFPSFADEASCFLSHFLITFTIWTLRGSTVNAQLFVTRLAIVLENSSAVDQNGTPLLTTQGFTWVVIKSIQDSHALFQDLDEDIALWPIIQAVDALRVFHTMTSSDARCEARHLFLRILSRGEFGAMN